MKQYKKGLIIESDNLELNYMIGKHYLKIHNIKKATNFFNKLLDICFPLFSTSDSK